MRDISLFADADAEMVFVVLVQLFTELRVIRNYMLVSLVRQR